jgi:signal transduction histidine kinase
MVTSNTPAVTGALPAPWLARCAAWIRCQLAGRHGERRVPDAIDWAIAAGCFVAFTVPVLLGAGLAGHSRDAVAAFGAMAAAPLVVRRRWPVAVVAAVAGVYVAATLAGVAFTPFVSNAGPDLAIAVFAAADRRPRQWSLPAAAGAAIATWAALPAAIALHPHQDQDAVQLLLIIPAWIAGDMTRVTRSYRQRLQLESRRRAAEAVQLARAEERLRLSREVHDVVSHSLSAIAVQAGMARHVLAEQPGMARAALSAIETSSRSALDELRGLLRQLRDPGEDKEAAMPTLGDLPLLVSKLRRAGLDVGYEVSGQPHGYSTAVELSGYRIAQEALTNVTKHARGARALVRIEHRDEELAITVTDDGIPGPPRSSGGGGLGITGMRERAELLGGTLTAGPAPDRGFTIAARLPTRQGTRD